ncbi:MAG: hypothetical protein IPI87_16505 [Betaproteobacteria bacterium]|nr:hypothetical protein [Betaproteobacteria bacterium]
MHREDLAAVLDQAEVLDARPVGVAARPERPVRDDVERIGVDDDALRVHDRREPVVDLAPREQHDALVREQRARVVDAAVAAGQIPAREDPPEQDVGHHIVARGHPSNQ